MPANIEIKARVHDVNDFRERAASFSDTPVERIPQEDVFFHAPRGRLKLRVLAPDSGQLVYYTRPDRPGPKRSDYRICATGQPKEMISLLSTALGVKGIVRKTRYLFLAGQTRIHLDEVEGLGAFMELEVMLRPGQPDDEGVAIAESLMRRLGIRPDDLIEGAYLDLMAGETPKRPPPAETS